MTNDQLKTYELLMEQYTNVRQMITDADVDPTVLHRNLLLLAGMGPGFASGAKVEIERLEQEVSRARREASDEVRKAQGAASAEAGMLVHLTVMLQEAMPLVRQAEVRLGQRDVAEDDHLRVALRNLALSMHRALHA
ncbi:hypothetical protein IB275_30355 [Pseudomonas sp. PDM21]|uniref:hypothetical protein n=1 Tax=Pseudomonas sp. PDM21 TaxID=2769257 RepID=UPI0017805947|nr:hypothetical protein [Pseudomonas sp. PDM21]MBD9674918.1 hypothetical protein [Pseudomonas sp. PDM21]